MHKHNSISAGPCHYSEVLTINWEWSHIRRSGGGLQGSGSGSLGVMKLMLVLLVISARLCLAPANMNKALIVLFMQVLTVTISGCTSELRASVSSKQSL